MREGFSVDAHCFLNKVKEALPEFEEAVGVRRGRPSMWPLYGSPSLYREGVRLLSELIAAQVQTSHFDYLCGIPHSGHPLTVSLAQELDKPAVCLSKDLSGTRSRQARALLNGKRLLLIDSSVNTGLSAALSAGTVQQLGAQPIGVACLFYNDTFPSPVPYLNDLLKQGKLWYLLKYSDLI